MRGRQRGWRREETARQRTDVDGDGDLFPSDVHALRCLLAEFASPLGFFVEELRERRREGEEERALALLTAALDLCGFLDPWSAAALDLCGFLDSWSSSGSEGSRMYLAFFSHVFIAYF
uniref:Uncharacterized protein n=1 Tax=Leersia perrieri TaxID=77586 RepID=A0A0D9W9Y1_9ORYZ